MVFDCAIIGGGLAGLQASIQLGRYRHRTLVLDSGDGRSSLCRCYHNIIGWPDGVSGQHLRQLGRLQAERLGVEFVRGRVVRAERNGTAGFMLTGDNGDVYESKRILLATGVQDRIPLKEQLLDCLGLSVFICPDCDGYETADRKTLVIGSGDAGASMALTLTFWTRDLIYINHERTEIGAAYRDKLVRHGIVYVEDAVAEIAHEQGRLEGIRLAGSGEWLTASHAFVAFGGNKVRTELAAQLGVPVAGSGHIEVDPRTKQTACEHIWAAGDVTAHSEQAAIAMGDGIQAAIWIHKSLLS
ncbi:NAD(P)/FAD-dependent oxidoreductase [Paenibacillus humicola]|uniref:NAD(P)/FAD-dependent oxidoreductase n=1 Tax=Paenibacillus humicola TaxID=3110540 RepID=UPI00237B1C9D|nr:NAD(P)/FAD-dependent oxidoreductase [Paenibacillus humicola]